MGAFLLLTGVHHIPSRTAALAEVVARRLESGGHVTIHHLVVGDSLASTVLDPIWIRRLRAAAVAADGFVLTSPVYHNSYSGVLKIALDHLDVALMERKPVGLCSTSGGQRSSQAIDHLRQVVRGLNAVSVPCQLATSDSDWAEEARGTFSLQAASLEDRLERFCTELAWYAQQLRPPAARTAVGAPPPLDLPLPSRAG